MSVSNALRHPQDVRPATLKKVYEAVSSLGGEIPMPQQAAVKPVIAHRPRRRLRLMIDNVTKPLMHAPVYGRLLHGIVDEVAKQNFDLSITNLDSSTCLSFGSLDEEVDVLLLMGKWKSCSIPPRVPVVTFMSTEYPLAADYVGYNAQRVGELVAEHFHRKGIRSAVYVGPDDRPERHDSFLSAFARLDNTIKIRSHLVSPVFQVKDGLQIISRETVEKLAIEITSAPLEAVFCFSDCLAASLRNACFERDHQWKAKIWAGCNNDPDLSLMLGRDSVSVEICAEQIGRLAAQRAVEIARKPGQPKQKLFLEPYIVLGA